MKAKKYISPEGSKSYLGEGDIFKQNNIILNYFVYNCKEYKQKNLNKFISHLSIIDIIFNLGKKSINYI